MSLFLLAGARRTGTTLLNSVCCSDPSANPLVAEAQILTRLVEAYRWGRLNFTLFGKSYFDDPEAYRGYFAGVAESFVEHARNRFAPAINLVLKNPEFSLVIDDVVALLPTAKVIVTVRDPRDQVVSELETGLRQIERGLANPAAANRDVAALSRTFAAYCAPLVQAVDRDPARFLFIRFEDLLLRTDDVLRALRVFTGMPLAQFDRDADWSRVDLNWEDYRDVPAIVPQYGRKFDNTRVGRFRTVLSADEIALVNDVCRPFLERFGYA